VGRLMIWLSGAAPRLLKRCPTERPKYIGIGTAIAITSIFAAVSMTFALNTDLLVPLPIAIIFAVAWGLAIMSLDRWLIVSLQRQPEPWRYLILIIPRLLLALLFGLVISTPFILQVFRPEIDNEIALLHEEDEASYYSQLSRSPLTLKMTSDQNAVSRLESVISSGGGLSPSPYDNQEYNGLVQRLNQAISQADSAFRQWQCQLYGTPAGSCQAGNGPLATASQKQYLTELATVGQDSSAVHSLQNQLLASDAAARADALAQARAALPSAEQQLHADISLEEDETASFNATNENDAGLLIRLKALDDATAGNSTLNAARWLLFMLFTIIEVLPIFVKVLLNLGPENTYEKILDIEETMILRAAREDALRRQAARTLE
jgi:Domain of unknown function (DUF4407)